MNTFDITKRKQGAFWTYLIEAQKGDRIIYHIGEHCGGVHRKDAMAAEGERKCFLFCKRHGTGQFAYLAVKR